LENFTIKELIEYGAIIGGILGGLWYYLKYKCIDNRKNTVDSSPTGMNRDGRIHDMLVELRTETRADRVQIFQFHNGDHYDNSVSIRRFSCCYEVVKDLGVASALGLYQNCLVSGYIDGLRVFVESNIPVTKLLYSDLSNGLYKSTMIDTGVYMHIGIPLKGMVKGELKITGLLLISYNDERAITRCSFDALIDEGHTLDTDTREINQRECDGLCPDCRYTKYITRLETELAKIN